MPFCRRTIAKPADPKAEWICGPHWKLVPKWRKARVRQARRQWERRHRLYRMTLCKAEWDDMERMRKLADRLWDRCKEEAIAAAGILP